MPPNSVLGYIYNVLSPPPSNPVRTVILEPGSFAEPVRVTISHINLYTTAFEALSYTWGPVPDRHETILIRNSDSEDFHSFAVRPNLLDALKHLRHLHAPRRLWIDAICINQEDLTERNTEVGRMGDIYSKARQVVVWLGLQGQETSTALETIKTLSAGVVVNASRREFSAQPGSQAELIHRNARLSTVSEAQWAALKSFINRPYFERLWVRQEVHLASQVVAQCGALHLAEWRDLEKVMLLLEQSPVVVTRARTRITNDEISFVRSLFPYVGSDKLHYILHRSSLCKYTNPRDVVYANLTLSPAMNALDIKPDYGLPIPQVYKDLVYKQIQHSGDLDILRSCDLENGSAKFSFASFVPDFSQERFESRLMESFYYANGGTRHLPLQITSQTVLELKGKYVSTITSVSDSIKPILHTDGANGEHATTVQVLKALHQWEPKGLLTREYATGGTLLDAYILLLTGAGAECRNWGSPSEEERRDIFLAAAWSGGDSELIHRHEYGEFRNQILSGRRGEVFFQTAGGHIGTSPVRVKPGDIVVALVGGTNPYVLRRRSPDEVLDTFHQMVGPCYLQGIMCGEAILGPLPEQWARRTHQQSWRACFQNRQSGEVTWEDPRLWPMPSPWQVHFCEFSSERESCDGSCASRDEEEEEDALLLKERHFVNAETGQKTKDDPRLDIHGLERGGIQLQTYALV